ncbi:MAG TPA: cysteine peptidase family C39 domain-containing protein [Candidatus Nanopelagicales bacterium]|nr:cysteine peptidase family C39 domain-containing protein [Candidatus Nanopelagicales bacterium]
MYLRKTPSKRMVKQEHPLSCGAACARQLLLDDGIAKPEAEIREIALFSPDFGGIFCSPLAAALEQLGGGRRYRGAVIDPEWHEVLFENTPFVAMLADHWVIVDQIDDETVLVRDPAGLPGIDETVGFEGVMRRDVFEERWTLGIHQAVYRL